LKFGEKKREQGEKNGSGIKTRDHLKINRVFFGETDKNKTGADSEIP